MTSQSAPTKTDVVVLGAGISGLVTAKCLLDDGFRVTVLERTGDVGGLWTFRENDFGVMSFTHINVSKYNYCFSDFPFPDDVPDFPHNTDMAQYIKDYTKKFKIYDHIKFFRKVTNLEKMEDGWRITSVQLEEDGKTVKTSDSVTEVFEARYVAIATGHHATPTMAKFLGQDSFPGEKIHSVDFKDVVSNGMQGKRVLIVGIGNSAVDAAVNCASIGRCKSVYISSRSGAWVVPNYVLGHPTDLYANRIFLRLPWKVATFIFESIIKLISGNPERWNLNPKMRALQTQPTVSPTLLHHIQRHEIKIVPNIQRIEGNRVYFMNSEHAEFDSIVFCTGYKIDLPFLSEDLKKTILDESSNSIQLYKNVFSPDIGHTLAFIGFVQPASGGVLTMSETQARWFTELCRGRVSLPTKLGMQESIKEEQDQIQDRYYHSARHTIQKDPIIYNDDIASLFGAKPELWKHPDIAWRLLLGSCGAYQWRLQGPYAWKGAKDAVKKVPLTELMHYSGVLALCILSVLLYFMMDNLSVIFIVAASSANLVVYCTSLTLVRDFPVPVQKLLFIYTQVARDMLLLGSCGAYQWRLQGPYAWKGAKDAVKKVPLTELMHYSGVLALCILSVLLYFMMDNLSVIFIVAASSANLVVYCTSLTLVRDFPVPVQKLLFIYTQVARDMLLLGSCGAYQWRLQGPYAWKGAKDAVKKVPLTELMHYSGVLALCILSVLLYFMYSCLSSIF